MANDSAPSRRADNFRVTQVSVVRPRASIGPEQLLESWPTLVDIAEAVQRAGAEVTVLQSFHRDLEIVARNVRYRFVREPALPGRATGLMPSRLARAARASMPDIIHVNGLDFGRHIAALCRVGPPVLVQDHASRADTRDAGRRRGLRDVSGAAFTASAQAEPFLAKGWLRADMPVFAVPESSTRFCAGDREVARARCGISGDPAVLWVGRLDANKDPMTILRAIEMAARALPGLQLWCCFDDRRGLSPLLPQLRSLVSASPDLAGRVHLLGRVPHADVETLCRAADFFMLASHHEGSGYALIEAMACGATPIVSDIPSFRQLTANGTVGALIPAGDPALFAQALVELAGRDRAVLRERTIGHFINTLSFDRVGAQLCDIYAALIRGRW